MNHLVITQSLVLQQTNQEVTLLQQWLRQWKNDRASFVSTLSAKYPVLRFDPESAWEELDPSVGGWQ